MVPFVQDLLATHPRHINCALSSPNAYDLPRVWRIMTDGNRLETFLRELADTA